MAHTKLSNIIVPEVFQPYMVNRTMELSAFVQSGIISNNPEFDRLASQAASTIQMPFYEDLTGASEQVIEDADLTAKNITTKKDVAPIIRRAAMWGATDLSAAMSGKDPMKAIADLVAAFWARDLQKELLAILTGVFSASDNSMDGHVLDISEGTGNAAKWSAGAFIDAQQLLGDAKAQLKAVCMHSAVEAALRKQQLIETVQPANDTAFNTYQGKRVIIDDGCPVSSGVYTTYLFGEGALALGNGNPEGFVPVEVDRDKKKGSGVDYLINRKTYILHPRGIKFTGTAMENSEGPSRAELATATNWSRVYEAKQIRMVAFKHKI